MSKDGIKRVTGLLVIEVRNANPNGDPDQESDPRNRGHDGRGLISAPSFKRKLRDLVEDKDGIVWKNLANGYPSTEFQILESRGRERKKIESMSKDEFQRTYWDARVFGNTFLEKNSADKEHLIRAGVAHFGTGISVAPVRIQRDTWTNKAGVEGDKDRGMAPYASRYVEHAVYCMPFFVNPNGAPKTGCAPRDIDLLAKLIPQAYRSNPSVARHGGVEIRHAWWIEHESPLGDCSDFALIDALTPTKKNEPEEPSSSWSEYQVPNDLPPDLKAKIASCRDLMA
jgi:Cas7 group CRISPR-associated protein Csh2